MSSSSRHATTAGKGDFVNRKEEQELEEYIAVEAAANLPINSTMQQDQYDAGEYMPVNNNHNNSSNDGVNDSNNQYMTREMQNMHFSELSNANSRSNASRVARPDYAGYYARLGLSTEASQRDIRRAFLELSRRYHTDKHACQSHAIQATMNDRFNELQEAYAVLIDPRQRAVYDAVGVHGLQYLALIPTSVVSPQNTVNYVQWLEREARLQRDAQILSSTCDVSIYFYPELLKHMMWPFRGKNARYEHQHQHQHQHQQEQQEQDHEQKHQNGEESQKLVEHTTKKADEVGNEKSDKIKSERQDNESNAKELANLKSSNSSSDKLYKKGEATTKFPPKRNSADMTMSEQTAESESTESYTTDNTVRNEDSTVDDRANSLASWTNNAGTLNIKTAFIDQSGSMTGSGKWNGENSLLFVVPLREESVDSVMTTLQKVKHKLQVHGKGVNAYDSSNNNNDKTNNSNTNMYTHDDILHDADGNVGNEEHGDYDANCIASANINNSYEDNDEVIHQQEQQVVRMKQMISRLPPHMVMLYDLRILLNAFTPKQMSGQYSFQHYIDSTRQVKFVVKNTHQMMSFKTFFERQGAIDNSALSLTMSSDGVKVKTTYARKLSQLWNLTVQTVLWQGNRLFPKLKISCNRFLSEQNIMQVDWVMRFLGIGYFNVVFMHLTNTRLLSDKEDSNKHKNNNRNNSYNDYKRSSSGYADSSTYSETTKSKYTNSSSTVSFASHNGRSLCKYLLHKCATLFHWFDNSKSWMASVHLAQNALICSARGVVDTIYCPLTIMTNQDEANKNVMNVRIDTNDKQIQRPERHLIERFRLSSTISYSPWQSTLTMGNEITYHASPKLSYGFAFDSEMYCNLNWSAMIRNTPESFYDWEHTDMVIAHVFRFVYNRSAHKIALPIIVIGNNHNLYCAAMWVVLPRLCFSIAKLVYNRRSFARERREAMLLRREHFAEVDIARERASMEQMALQRTIDQSRTLEEKGNGLVIVNATYGVLEPEYSNESNIMVNEMHNHSGSNVAGIGDDNDNDDENTRSVGNSRIGAMSRITSSAWRKYTNFIYSIGAWPFGFAHGLSCDTSNELSNDLAESDPCQEETPLTIDVTLALQNLVHDSTLTLPPVTKSVLVGFCDPDPYTNEQKQLKITYRFQRKVHQVIYDDEDEVRLPQEAHLIHTFA